MKPSKVVMDEEKKTDTSLLASPSGSANKITLSESSSSPPRSNNTCVDQLEDSKGSLNAKKSTCLLKSSLLSRSSNKREEEYSSKEDRPLSAHQLFKLRVGSELQQEYPDADEVTLGFLIDKRWQDLDQEGKGAFLDVANDEAISFVSKDRKLPPGDSKLSSSNGRKRGSSALSPSNTKAPAGNEPPPLRRSRRERLRTSYVEYETFVEDYIREQDDESLEEKHQKSSLILASPSIRVGREISVLKLEGNTTQSNVDHAEASSLETVTGKSQFDEMSIQGCPHQLFQQLVKEIRSEDKKLSYNFAETQICKLWNRIPDEIKKTIPSPGSKHYDICLQLWKAEHLGDLTPKIDAISIPGCPKRLIQLYIPEIIKRQRLSYKVAREKLTNLWNNLSKDAIEKIPLQESESYEDLLKAWKREFIDNSSRKKSTMKIQKSLPYSDVNNTDNDGDSSVDSQEQITKQTKRKGSHRDSKRNRNKKPLNNDGSSADSQELITKRKRRKLSNDTSNHDIKRIRNRSSNIEDEKKDEYCPREDVVCQVIEGPASFELVEDPNEVYIEEEAHLYHNPPIPSFMTNGVEPRDLKPIPPPPSPFTELPNTGKCDWTFDEKQRLLLADFSASSNGNNFRMHPTDESFFLEMMERNDITVISEGLVSTSSLDPEYWKLEYLARVLKQEYYHKFRRFDTIKDDDGFEKCIEVDGLHSMKVGDYIQYLIERQKVFDGKETNEVSFSFVDHEGRKESIPDIGVSAIYMIDLDINKLLPNLYDNFMDSFRYPGVLPGGYHCMMNSVTTNARPYMGPNMYVTPPAAFTHFHQDGHGTVDSGHLCLKGYNEVVMLRRLTERHKKHALMILTGDLENHGKKEDTDHPPRYFDGLYQEPHGDKLGEKPAWPTTKDIERCREMGYCPTICIVKPGQLIHINKGRLHAFRKMATTSLRDDDCHRAIREQIIKENNLKGEELCISIAWDWMYRGISSEGINREVSSTLEAAVLNQKMGKVSLAIPELSLLQMAKMFPLDTALVPADLNGLVGFNKTETKQPPEASDAITVCRGILPSLKHVIKKQAGAMEKAAMAESRSFKRGARVTIARRPNTHEDPAKFPVDPYGNSDFICKLCSKELSNVYFHCDGCEILLSKDFNICQRCHTEKKFMQTITMHPTNPKRHATLNHTGNLKYDRQSRCPCKNGPVCGVCHYCLGCSCRCHSWFTLHSRLFSEGEGQSLLSRVEFTVDTSKRCEPNKYLDDPEFLEKRLEIAAKPFGTEFYVQTSR